ncbi:alcohol dehydrogenase, class IV [Desulfitobacterium dichloroeliminans LMG P-21439]|uniref:Alcohol dehydrogenase, class IV n=1 Tax=Desulfitobacterium dichloroeliminans (strain LMG P-21439 / DCA1) TaxID=871963 RepID=L0F5I5_DESDL|nr:iron-containing alcohol dehydrogenase [Desulfitobacterium dichloroeliminans]AGA68208.1 alcohol dehydrogenase, class IV [Desulfitobacterium dichloroeliminans LMG P-21439]
MYKLYCRTFQRVLKLGTYFIPWRTPKLLEGEKSLGQLPRLIKYQGINNVLIVTDKGISSLGLMNSLLKGLEDVDIKYSVYDEIVPNPTIDNIEEALKLYHNNKCKGIIAFGGGSPMDCAKGVGARIARPHKKIPQMKGLFKVLKKIPPLFAIPTTAGTGSEATIAAVITNQETHEKYAINDLVLIPKYAVLDPALTVGLPPHITSTTGLDALTHAVESYIGRSNTRETKELSRKAVNLIFDNLFEAYSNGTNLVARENMQKASFYAGIAFTRAYVGYVHALAHPLGGFYGTPHGLANAVILPYVLEYYGEPAHKPLAELADLIGISEKTDTAEEKALKFIDAIKKLNQSMEIPETICGIMEKDIPTMSDRAFKEANPLYPVPRILSREDLIKLYDLIRVKR